MSHSLCALYYNDIRREIKNTGYLPLVPLVYRVGLQDQSSVNCPRRFVSVSNTVVILHCSHQIWRQPFQEFALQWLDAIGHSFQTLVPQLTYHDTWTAAEVNFTLPQKRHHKMSKARPTAQRPMGARSAFLQSLMHSQHSAFNTVSSSSSAPLKVSCSCNYLQSY